MGISLVAWCLSYSLSLGTTGHKEVPIGSWMEGCLPGRVPDIRTSCAVLGMKLPGPGGGQVGWEVCN